MRTRIQQGYVVALKILLAIEVPRFRSGLYVGTWPNFTKKHPERSEGAL